MVNSIKVAIQFIIDVDGTLQMWDPDKLDKIFRNIGLFLILLSIPIIIIGFNIEGGFQSQLILTVGIATLLSGLLIFTRMQFVIWTLKIGMCIFLDNS